VTTPIRRPVLERPVSVEERCPCGARTALDGPPAFVQKNLNTWRRRHRRCELPPAPEDPPPGAESQISLRLPDGQKEIT
jgi:hypothetical protein